MSVTISNLSDLYTYILNSLLHFHQLGLGGKVNDASMDRDDKNHARKHVDYINEVYIKCFLETRGFLYFLFFSLVKYCFYGLLSMNAFVKLLIIPLENKFV
jgi:hypothetical protein